MHYGLIILKVVIESVPVKLAIIFKIKKDPANIISPPIAVVNVFFAPSTALGSPPEVKYLKPPERNIINKTIPPNASKEVTTFSKIPSKLDRVAGAGPI